MVYKKLVDSPLTIVLILLVLSVSSQLVYGMRTFDDAFITFRYARNISDGTGFVYNPGQAVLGTSSPLFSLFLALAGKLFSPATIPQASFFSGLVFEALNCLLLYRISSRIFKKRFLAVLVAAAYIFQPIRLDVVTGGMETSLYLTLLLLMYHDFILGEMRWTAAVWAGLAFLVRPDSLLAILPVFILWLIRDRRGFITGCLVFGLVITPWILFAFTHFGSLLPNTILAKSIAYRNPPGHALWFFATFFSSGTLNIFLPPAWIICGFIAALIVIMYGSRKLVNINSLLAGWVVFPVIFCTVMSVRNPAMWFPWYYLPLVPIGILSLITASWFAGESAVRSRWLITLVFSLLIFAAPQVIARSFPSWDSLRQREAAFWEACEFIEPMIEKGDSVLSPDIGVIGWCLEQATILDPIGLVSPEALPYQLELEPNQWVSPGLIDDFQPEYIISFDFYLQHALRSSSVLEEDYRLIWYRDLALQSESRRLVIYQRTSPTG